MSSGEAVLAFDIGGTRIKAARITHDQVGGFCTTSSTGDVLATVAGLGRSLIDLGEVNGVGICTPGLVGESVVRHLPGKLPSIVGRDLAAFCRDEFGVPGFAVNDAIAYAVGETLAGAGRGATRVVVVTIGTGVGVACIDNGRPVSAGMWGGGTLGGYIPIAETSPSPDSNGQHGTIEALCAAQRIVDACGGRFASVPDVFDAYARGDEVARDGLAGYRRSLTTALVALYSAHAPDAIVVGGGPVFTDSPVLDGLEAAVNARIFAGAPLPVRPAELGDTAALVGLARLAAQR